MCHERGHSRRRSEKAAAVSVRGDRDPPCPRLQLTGRGSLFVQPDVSSARLVGAGTQDDPQENSGTRRGARAWRYESQTAPRKGPGPLRIANSNTAVARAEDATRIRYGPQSLRSRAEGAQTGSWAKARRAAAAATFPFSHRALARSRARTRPVKAVRTCPGWTRARPTSSPAVRGCTAAFPLSPRRAH